MGESPDLQEGWEGGGRMLDSSQQPAAPLLRISPDRFAGQSRQNVQQQPRQLGAGGLRLHRKAHEQHRQRRPAGSLTPQAQLELGSAEVHELRLALVGHLSRKMHHIMRR